MKYILMRTWNRSLDEYNSQLSGFDISKVRAVDIWGDEVDYTIINIAVFEDLFKLQELFPRLIIRNVGDFDIENVCDIGLNNNTKVIEIYDDYRE